MTVLESAVIPEPRAPRDVSWPRDRAGPRGSTCSYASPVDAALEKRGLRLEERVTC